MSECTQLSDHTWTDFNIFYFLILIHYPLNMQIEELKYM